MKLIRSTLIASVLLASLSSISFAQTGPASNGPSHDHMAKMHERMAQRHAQHLSKLKTQLKIEKEQEASWEAFTQVIQNRGNMHARPDRSAMEKMSTPERLDWMQKHRAQMDAQMQKHIDATKVFYASLNNEQKKVFDTESAKFFDRGHKEHRHPH